VGSGRNRSKLGQAVSKVNAVQASCAAKRAPTNILTMPQTTVMRANCWTILQLYAGLSMIGMFWEVQGLTVIGVRVLTRPAMRRHECERLPVEPPERNIIFKGSLGKVLIRLMPWSVTGQTRHFSAPARSFTSLRSFVTRCGVNVIFVPPNDNNLQ
jgi:hypothetical protein